MQQFAIFLQEALLPIPISYVLISPSLTLHSLRSNRRQHARMLS